MKMGLASKVTHLTDFLFLARRESYKNCLREKHSEEIIY